MDLQTFLNRLIAEPSGSTLKANKELKIVLTDYDKIQVQDWKELYVKFIKKCYDNGSLLNTYKSIFYACVILRSKDMQMSPNDIVNVFKDLSFIQPKGVDFTEFKILLMSKLENYLLNIECFSDLENYLLNLFTLANEHKVEIEYLREMCCSQMVFIVNKEIGMVRSLMQLKDIVKTVVGLKAVEVFNDISDFLIAEKVRDYLEYHLSKFTEIHFKRLRQLNKYVIKLKLKQSDILNKICYLINSILKINNPLRPHKIPQELSVNTTKLITKNKILLHTYFNNHVQISLFEVITPANAKLLVKDYKYITEYSELKIKTEISALMRVSGHRFFPTCYSTRYDKKAKKIYKKCRIILSFSQAIEDTKLTNHQLSELLEAYSFLAQYKIPASVPTSSSIHLNQGSIIIFDFSLFTSLQPYDLVTNAIDSFGNLRFLLPIDKDFCRVLNRFLQNRSAGFNKVLQDFFSSFTESQENYIDALRKLIKSII